MISCIGLNGRYSVLRQMLMVSCAMGLGMAGRSAMADAPPGNVMPYAETAPAPVTPPFPPEKSTGAVPAGTGQSPVEFAADNLIHDEDRQRIVAFGNVELSQDGRIVRAEKITYDLKNDRVTAEGEVVLTEPNGDVHFARDVRLSNEFKDGFVAGLQSMLADGSRFSAQKGERVGGTKLVMHQATYTPCNTCSTDGKPLWQIKADKVTHDKTEQRISYEDATLEVAGVPILYTPRFSHPDGTVKQKSGFLSPTFGYDSELGAVVSNSYYWALSPSQDLTLGTKLMTQKAPLLTGQYRKRFEDAKLELEGSTTYSSRTDSIAGQDVEKDEETRGHMFADALWDIDNKWRAGLNLELTSDDQYLRQYDISNKDVLENELYAERFSGRNYAVGRLMSFQDVRVREERSDQPDILPEIVTSFYGEPNGTLGGRWNLEASALGLRRDGSGQDMTRLVTRAGWEKRMVSSIGFVSTLDLSMRADAYKTTDRLVMNNNDPQQDDGDVTRLFPQANLVTSYPMVKPMEKMQALIEPSVGVTLGTNVNSNDRDIPNEDSQDAQIDASNLFEPDRFPGEDRIEDKSRVTYGVKTGLYGYDGNFGEIFLGQSYRFDKDDNPFPEGSGLNEQRSDIVGQISAGTRDMELNYRFQLGEDNLSSQRHELDSNFQVGPFGVDTTYLYARALEGTTIDESREQVSALLSYDVTSSWRTRIGALQDLGDDPGLRKALFGVDYVCDCLGFSATVKRSLTSDASGDSSTEVLFSLNLKQLGSVGKRQEGLLEYDD